MIPRRRIDIGMADIADMIASMWDAPERDREMVFAFEAAASAVLGGVPTRATASGRDALDLILEGLGLGPGSEVLVPAYTLGELVQRLRLRGYAVRAADVDPETFCVTPDTVGRALTPATRAIIALHAFGAPCEMDGLASLAAERDLPLIEDCAHAFGASIGGRPVGGLGDAALFSLEVAKPVATFGGGLLATRDAALLAAAEARLALRHRSSWPAMRKTVMKCGEELAVRSPAYAIAARLLFTDRRAGSFERVYRGLHDRVRGEHVAYCGFQARRGLRRIEGLARRNAMLNKGWDELADLLPDSFRPQVRDRFGDPVPYSFVALYRGSPTRLRRSAQARGLDLAIGGEVLDDVAPMLGQHDCPGAAMVHASAVGIPLHLGVDAGRRQRIAKVLREVAG